MRAGRIGRPAIETGIPGIQRVEIKAAQFSSQCQVELADEIEQ